MPVHVENAQDFSNVVARFWSFALCALRELPSTDHDPHLTTRIIGYFYSVLLKKKKKVDKRTSVSGNFVQPLRLFGLIPTLPSPSRYPSLALLVPYLPITSLRLYTLCACEFFPLRRRFGFWEWFCARELCGGCWQLSEGTFGRRDCWEREERGDEELNSVTSVFLEIRFALVAGCIKN